MNSFSSSFSFCPSLATAVVIKIATVLIVVCTLFQSLSSPFSSSIVGVLGQGIIGGSSDRTQQELALLPYTSGVRTAYCQQSTIAEMLDPFKETLARMVTRYCKNPEPCGLKKAVTFTKHQVVVLDTYPRRENRGLNFRFFVVLPHEAVPVERKARDKPLLSNQILSHVIESQLRELTHVMGWQVLDFEHYPRFDRTTQFMNKALIPIAVVAFLCMLLLAYWSSTITSGSALYSAEGWRVSGNSGGKNAALRRTLEIIEEQKARFALYDSVGDGGARRSPYSSSFSGRGAGERRRSSYYYYPPPPQQQQLPEVFTTPSSGRGDEQRSSRKHHPQENLEDDVGRQQQQLQADEGQSVIVQPSTKTPAKLVTMASRRGGEWEEPPLSPMSPSTMVTAPASVGPSRRDGRSEQEEEYEEPYFEKNWRTRSSAVSTATATTTGAAATTPRSPPELAAEKRARLALDSSFFPPQGGGGGGGGHAVVPSHRHYTPTHPYSPPSSILKPGAAAPTMVLPPKMRGTVGKKGQEEEEEEWARRRRPGTTSIRLKDGRGVVGKREGGVVGRVGKDVSRPLEVIVVPPSSESQTEHRGEALPSATAQRAPIMSPQQSSMVAMTSPPGRSGPISPTSTGLTALRRQSHRMMSVADEFKRRKPSFFGSNKQPSKEERHQRWKAGSLVLGRFSMTGKLL